MHAWEQFLEENYFDPSVPGAYGGPQKVLKILRDKDFKVTLKQVKGWLGKQDAYTLFRSTKSRFKRNVIITTGLDNIWDVDLAEVGNISSDNDSFRYFLIVIDIFSRFLWVRPLKSKTADEVVKAFTDILSSTKRRPEKIRSDNGKEFVNKKLKAFFKDRNIHGYTTKNETKANYAERVIRTLKGLMYRYFLHRQTYRYVENLQNLVYNYNNRPHRSLKGRSPASISSKNEGKVWAELYLSNKKPHKRAKFKFSVGDQVRISHLKYVFQRDYHEKWTEEVFKISYRFYYQGLAKYRLVDYESDKIIGTFYESELQKVTQATDNLFRIEKVLKKRRRNGRTELLIKWTGWPKKFNSWVDELETRAIE